MDGSPALHMAEHLVRAAGIPLPWRATRCRVDDITKSVHLWITRHPLQTTTKKRSWFGFESTAPTVSQHPTGPEMSWRHLNCMDYVCQVHTDDLLEEQHHALPWLGQPGLPFSNRMARHVFTCLMEGMEMGVICSQLNIPFPDLWKFKYALDNGMVKFEHVPAAKPRQAISTAAADTTARVSTAPTELLGVVDSVWEGLLSGSVDIQIKTLSFQLLLSRLRQQMSLQESTEVKLMKLRELHRYVERNARSLEFELEQMRAISLSVQV